MYVPIKNRTSTYYLGRLFKKGFFFKVSWLKISTDEKIRQIFYLYFSGHMKNWQIIGLDKHSKWNLIEKT